MMTPLPLPAAKIERSGLWNLKTHTEIRVNLGTGIEPVKR